jgi:hypothetical protein
MAERELTFDLCSQLLAMKQWGSTVRSSVAEIVSSNTFLNTLQSKKVPNDATQSLVCRTCGEKIEMDDLKITEHAKTCSVSVTLPTIDHAIDAEQIHPVAFEKHMTAVTCVDSDLDSDSDSNSDSDDCDQQLVSVWETVQSLGISKAEALCESADEPDARDHLLPEIPSSEPRVIDSTADSANENTLLAEVSETDPSDSVLLITLASEDAPPSPSLFSKAVAATNCAADLADLFKIYASDPSKRTSLSRCSSYKSACYWV